MKEAKKRGKMKQNKHKKKENSEGHFFCCIFMWALDL